MDEGSSHKQQLRSAVQKERKVANSKRAIFSQVQEVKGRQQSLPVCNPHFKDAPLAFGLAWTMSGPAQAIGRHPSGTSPWHAYIVSHHISRSLICIARNPYGSVFSNMALSLGSHSGAL